MTEPLSTAAATEPWADVFGMNLEKVQMQRAIWAHGVGLFVKSCRQSENVLFHFGIFKCTFFLAV